MSVTASVEVVGLKSALKELNKTQPALRREIGKDIKKAAEPILSAIRELSPETAPLSGMDHLKRTGWKRGQDKNIVLKVDTRNARKRNAATGAVYESVGTVKVIAKGGPLIMADMAGRAGGMKSKNAFRARPNFHSALDGAIGRGASRFMWAGAEKNIDLFQKELEPIVARVMAEVGRNIVEVKR
jgi:hypothetical protein